jgi:predicted  nucleic acid-binding Zn-ribbon protein
MWQVPAGLGIALALALGSFKLYYDKAEAEKKALQAEVQQAIRNQALLETTISDQNLEIEEQQKKQQAVLLKIDRLTQEHQEAMREVEDIRKKFAKHDLDVLSLRKPKLIEKIINRGTADVFTNLESITDPAS